MSKKNIKHNEIKQWREQCKRQLKRSLKDRINYGFVYTYKKILDDVPFRVFNSIKEYKKWGDKNLPAYLGYKLGEKKKSI